MTKRQRWALHQPCARAVETLAPHFRADIVRHQRRWSTILTINR